MLRGELLIATIFLLAAAAVLAFLLAYNTPNVIYYWPVLTLDTKHVPVQAPMRTPHGFLNFKIVPARDDSEPDWPSMLSWRVLDSRGHVVFAGNTNLEEAEDLGWRRPFEMRELSFAQGTWHTNEQLKPDEVYRLQIVSAEGVTRPGEFVIDMYYVAPLRISDRLSCFGICVRRRNPADIPGGLTSR